MCDFSGKLVAWMDHELATDEMAEVERHFAGCAECRKQLSAYQQVSKGFDVYCDAIAAYKVPRRLPRWVPVVAGVSAAAIAATVIAVLLIRTPVTPPVLTPSVKVAPPVLVIETTAAPVKAIHRRHAATATPIQTGQWLPVEPAIQIAIPAESMFPPGALPEGVNFTADLSIAADGSAQQIRLHPRLISFERKTKQP